MQSAPDAEPMQMPATDTGPASEAGLRLSIDGWAEQLGAKAQVNVIEGVPAVRLEITGTGEVDVLLLDLDFDGIEGTMGLHDVDVGLPGDALDSAFASLGGQSYHSQSGRIQVTLSSDGGITGSFAVSLALDPEFVPGAPPVKFELADEVRPLSGAFAGHWGLFCQSHLPGHSSLMTGGHYCDGIAFE